MYKTVRNTNLKEFFSNLNNNMKTICLLILLGGYTNCSKDDDFDNNSIPYRNIHSMHGNFDIIAHRGVWIDSIAPENSTHAVNMAKIYGFQAVECDVRTTSDGHLMIMHDNTINRTCRNAHDYSVIMQDIPVSEYPFEYLRNNFVLVSKIKKYRTPIPTLEEFLRACKDNDIFPLLHGNTTESFNLAQKILGNNWCCFSTSLSTCIAARKVSDCLILYSDNSTADGIIDILSQIGGWCGYSTTSSALLTADLCENLKSHGWEIQCSIPKVENSVYAIRNGITMLLSDYNIDLKRSAKLITNIIGDTFFENFNFTGTMTGTILNLLPEQTISKTWKDSIQFGGIDIEVYYKGSIDVRINNNNYKGFTRDNLGIDRFSLRFANKLPNLLITSTSDTEIHDISVRLAKF
jgi:hypothetical protein